MLDPPTNANNVDNIAFRQLLPNCGHLRRLLTSTTQADEPKCEYILLLPYTRIGQSHTNNHVVLNCSDEINSAIRGCHAIIRSVVTDKLHGNISNYELVAQKNACVYINCCQVEVLKPHKLYSGDLILFGDKATNFDGFMFKFELADEKLDYPVMRQNLRPEFTSTPHNLILYSNSLNYRVGDLSQATIENEANLALDETPKQPYSTQKPLVSEFIYDLINNCQSTTTYSTSMPLNFSSKENVISYAVRPSTSIKASTMQHSFVDLNNGNMLQLCPSLPEPTLVEEGTKTRLLNDKFDVDIYEVVKRIASRIANKQDNLKDDLDSSTNNGGDEKNVVEDTNLQLPMIASAANLNVYQCSTSLTPSSSASPPCSIDFRHTPSSSSSVFNNSDTSGYSTNDNSGNCTINNNNLTPSPACIEDEEEERKSLKNEKIEENAPAEDESLKSLSKSASATSLQLLAALASNGYNDDDDNNKPLEIFIPLASCSDRDESLSPAQTLKSEKLISPTPSSTHRGPKPRSSRQSTHENDEAHTHSTKQLKLQAGIDSCRKRMFKYIANNMYTTQIVQHYQPMIPSPVVKSEVAQDVKMEEPQVASNQQFNSGTPVPLNLYPDGEELVTKEVKTRRNSKKQTVRVDTITDAEQHLFATLLLQLRSPSAPSTLDSSISSSNTVPESTNNDDVEVKEESPVNEANTKCEEMEVDKEKKEEEEEKKKVVVRPSKEEKQVFLQVEQILPRIYGVGRHTVAKYRLLYRSELDRRNAETVATQRYRLIERCREDRLKCEEKMKQVQQRKQQIAERRKSNAKRSNADQLPSPTGRNTLGSPVVARLPIIKKSSTSKQSGTLAAKRQSTDYSTYSSIHHSAKDPNFDGFSMDESKNKDSFRLNEDEDLSSGKKTAISPLNRPFFATENARVAAISANQNIHSTQQKRSRKRRQSDDANILDKSVSKPTVKGKRGRQPGQKVGKQGKKRKIEKEEACAFMNCSPQHIQIVAATSAVEWVACDNCSQWYHCVCVLGLNRPVGEFEKFQCSHCQPPN